METKKAMAVVVLIFLKYNGLCGGLADSIYFLQKGINTAHEFSSTLNVICVHVTFTVVTVHTICEDLHCDYFLSKLNKKDENLSKKNFMDPYFGWSSTVSRLKSH